MIHPTLYALDSLKNIRSWRMERDGCRYRTISGLVNGAQTTSEWTIAEGKNTGRKNATTPEQQAESEILNLYKKKKKLKYFESLDDVSGSNYFEPMLAKKFKDYKNKIEFPVYVQVKLNGKRAIATKYGIFSRKGERYFTVPHIEESLSSFFEKYPDAILDGEMFNFELREKLNEIIKLVNKTVHITEEDLAHSKNLIKFYVYDGFGFGVSSNDSYRLRKEKIDAEIASIAHCEKVETFLASSKEEVDSIYNKFTEQRHEGAMIRIPKSPYKNGRSSDLLKMKPTDDAEFTILSIEKGDGNWSCGAKVIWCEYIDGRKFKANFKGTMEQSLEMWQNKESFIGQVVTICYNGLTGKGDGLPNYAQFDYNNFKK